MAGEPPDPVLCGTLPSSRVMADLADSRRAFHSEADFQVAVALTVARLDSSIRLRAGVRQRGATREMVDLVCRGPDRTTFLELKYFTAKLAATDPLTGERLELHDQAARDLARLNFVHDIRRLERFTDNGYADDGIAIILTNDAHLWRVPRRKPRNDGEFRIHEGATLTGELRWAGMEQHKFNHTLRGSYTAHWRAYAPPLPGTNGEFHMLAVAVDDRPAWPRQRDAGLLTGPGVAPQRPQVSPAGHASGG